LNTTTYTIQITIRVITAIAVAGWPTTIPALITIVVGMTMGHIYMTAQLPVKRLMSNAKSPIIGHIQNALVGLGSKSSRLNLLTFH
jgi:hypothetical protein